MINIIRLTIVQTYIIYHRFIKVSNRNTSFPQVAAPAAPASPAAETSEDYGKGIVFYTKEKTVVGILLWNCFNRMSLARQVREGENNKTEDNLQECR